VVPCLGAGGRASWFRGGFPCWARWRWLFILCSST